MLNFMICIEQSVREIFVIRGNFKSLQKWQKILVAICKWSVFGLSSGVLTKEDGKPRSNYHFQLINNLFSAKFCRTFEITSNNQSFRKTVYGYGTLCRTLFIEKRTYF